MKKIKLKSYLELDGDIILFPNEQDYSYHKKKLKNLDSDMFADMIMDNSDFDNNFKGIEGLTDVYEIDYLNHIPKIYTRVYLYGVWELLKESIKLNKK